ncbi:MAG: ATP-binding cassette domain-containing protein [Candidatus Caldarchaeum sp.]
MPHIVLYGVSKRYSKTIALQEVSLSIERSEIFSIQGASGCGKTTTLRVIAGLVAPDSGKVYIDDRDVTEVPPEKRKLGMVFQDYALWPRMTVFDNIAFRLKIRKTTREEMTARVKEVLEPVDLESFEYRYPTQLSGGQQ